MFAIPNNETGAVATSKGWQGWCSFTIRFLRLLCAEKCLQDRSALFAWASCYRVKLQANDVFILVDNIYILTFRHHDGISGRWKFSGEENMNNEKRFSLEPSISRESFIESKCEKKVTFNVYLLLFTHRIKLLSLFSATFFGWWGSLSICLFASASADVGGGEKDFLIISIIPPSPASRCIGINIHSNLSDKTFARRCKAIYHCSVIMLQKLERSANLDSLNLINLCRPFHLQFPLISCCQHVMCDGNFFLSASLFSAFLCALASCQKWNLISHNDNVIIIRHEMVIMMIMRISFKSWRENRLMDQED